MYTFTPKKTNNIATVLIVVLFAASAVAFVFPSVIGGMAYEGILQMLSLAFSIAALALLSRYVFKSFTYKVHENEGGNTDLDVVETQGKRIYTVCRIALANIQKVEIMTNENKKALKKEFVGRKKFYYLPDMLPSRSIAIFVTECGEPLVLVLSYDETLLSILSAN